MAIDYAPAQRKRPPVIGKPVAIFIAAALVLILAAPLWYPFTPAGRQQRNMQKAEKYLPTFAPRIQADPRFDGVEVHVTTAGGGAIFIHGYVRTNADLSALQAIADAAKQDVNPMMKVEVDPDLANQVAQFRKP